MLKGCSRISLAVRNKLIWLSPASGRAHSALHMSYCKINRERNLLRSPKQGFLSTRHLMLSNGILAIGGFYQPCFDIGLKGSGQLSRHSTSWLHMFEIVRILIAIEAPCGKNENRIFGLPMLLFPAPSTGRLKAVSRVETLGGSPSVTFIHG